MSSFLGFPLGGRAPPVGGGVLVLITTSTIRVMLLLVLMLPRSRSALFARVSLLLVALFAFARRRRGRALVVAQVELSCEVQLLHYTFQQVLDLRLVALVDGCKHIIYEKMALVNSANRPK